MGSLLNMSGGSLLSKGLPYDYEVEYLESDGTDNYIAIANKLYDFEVQFYVPQGQRNVVIGFNKPNGAIVERLNNINPVISIILNGTKFTSDVQIYGLHTVSYKNGDVLIDGIYKTHIPNNQEIGSVRLFAGDQTYYIQRIYSLKLYEQSNTMMSLIPVVKDNIGYMYDKVSGTLFGNAGAGSFIVGPRVS